MHFCVTYDISSNRLRRIAARLCKQAGLLRLQRSVFFGKAPKKLIAEMETQIRAEMSHNDSLCILFLSQENWDQMRLFGQNPTKEILGRTETARYF